MKIIKLISSKVLGEYELGEWNRDQWNLKKDSNKIWQYFHFGFLLLSGILHGIGAITIIPPVYNLLLTRIHIMQVSAWISTASAVTFACADILECLVEIRRNRSYLMKLLALFCLYSSYVFVQTRIIQTEQISNTFVGLMFWLMAGRLLAYGRTAKLLVMTKCDVINSLVLSRSLQVHLEAIWAIIGVIEFITANSFLFYVEQYKYFYYGVALNLCISVIRIGAALLIYRHYYPKKQQFTEVEQLNTLQDSL